MKKYKEFLNENRGDQNEIPDEISIESFLNKIEIPNFLVDNISGWWNENRSHIEIYSFPFNTGKPIMGGILGKNKIAINDITRLPPHIKLFIALHESRHCDQHNNDEFMDGYFHNVENENLEEFLRAYLYLERDANDFAIASMRDCGFNREMNFEEERLRSNEGAGKTVYRMMREDIMKYNPNDIFDLIKIQIL